MTKKIIPTILKGTRDFSPEACRHRKQVFNTMENIFERFGYTPIETPILSPAETILGKYGTEGEKLTYHFNDAGDRHIALPYDLTVPFARYVATNLHRLTLPFKRYQTQRVWRAEKPQKGRLREFYQCDIDIIGSKSLLCEAEMARIIVEIFLAIGIEDFIIKINSRRLLNAVLADYSVPQDMLTAVIRVIDKINKIGNAAVTAELEALGMHNAGSLFELLQERHSNKETLQHLSCFDISDIDVFFDYCAALSVPESYLTFDPTLARGLDYYTGLTFEVLDREAEFGTLCAGGRYDHLCMLFSDNDLSGTGVSFGFERIMLMLEKLGCLNDAKVKTNVLVTLFDAQERSALTLYDTLIKAGIAAEIYFEADKLGKQFKYAHKKKIPLVLMQGPEEIADKIVTIKRMQDGSQKKLPQSQTIPYLLSIVG